MKDSRHGYWLIVLGRLIADATVIDDELRHGDPTDDVAAALIESMAILMDRFDQLTGRIGAGCRGTLNADAHHRLVSATEQLRSTAASFAELPEAVDPGRSKRRVWAPVTPT